MSCLRLIPHLRWLEQAIVLAQVGLPEGAGTGFNRSLLRRFPGFRHVNRRFNGPIHSVVIRLRQVQIVFR
jgi:hypothetical protein